ncbi:hypothetical protein NRF20_21090 [Streptomyces sp. R-74717]|uniref:hypothetical protein n=1 Tax=Streptomyces TaxID=1883 RepID=UPI0037A4A0C1
MPERHRRVRPAVAVTGAAVLATFTLVAVRMSVGTPPERPRARQVTEQEVTAVAAGAGVTRSPDLVVGVMKSGRGAKEESAVRCSFAWGRYTEPEKRKAKPKGSFAGAVAALEAAGWRVSDRSERETFVYATLKKSGWTLNVTGSGPPPTYSDSIVFTGSAEDCRPSE